jgi:hypothetical protein
MQVVVFDTFNDNIGHFGQEGLHRFLVFLCAFEQKPQFNDLAGQCEGPQLPGADAEPAVIYENS